MRKIQLKLPISISVNSMYLPLNSSIVLLPKVKSYYNTVSQIVNTEFPNFASFEGRLRIYVEIFEENKRKRDINNYTKSLFDALEKAKVYKNDHQIDETFIKRGDIITKESYILVKIEEIKECDEREKQENMELQNKKNEILNKLIKKTPENTPNFEDYFKQKTNKQGNGKWKR